MNTDINNGKKIGYNVFHGVFMGTMLLDTINVWLMCLPLYINPNNGDLKEVLVVYVVLTLLPWLVARLLALIVAWISKEHTKLGLATIIAVWLHPIARAFPVIVGIAIGLSKGVTV